MDVIEKERLKKLAKEEKKSQERLKSAIFSYFGRYTTPGIPDGIIGVIDYQTFILKKEYLTVRELIEGLRHKYPWLEKEQIENTLSFSITCGLIRIDEDNKVYVMSREDYNQ